MKNVHELMFTAKNAVKGACRAASEHAPEALIVLGTGGLIASIVMAVKATPKAQEKLKELGPTTTEVVNEATGRVTHIEEEPTKFDEAKAVLPVYAPSIGMAVISVGAICGGLYLSKRHSLAMMSAYSSIADRLDIYQKKVLESVGNDKAVDVAQAVQTEIRKNEEARKSTIVTSDNDLVLCQDGCTGRYFHSSRTKLREIEAVLNARIADKQLSQPFDDDIFVPLNDFYDFFSEEMEECDLGAWLGFTPNHPMRMRFTATLRNSDGAPCLLVTFKPTVVEAQVF